MDFKAFYCLYFAAIAMNIAWHFYNSDKAIIAFLFKF